jgi:Reverse transcriptase (RNA-dependent DNA polymerase)
MVKPDVDVSSAVSLGRAQLLTTHASFINGDIVYETQHMDTDNGDNEPLISHVAAPATSSAIVDLPTSSPVHPTESITHSTDLAWIPDPNTSKSMPSRWRTAAQRAIKRAPQLSRFTSVSLVRLYVTPDGSCAGGALVRALSDITLSHILALLTESDGSSLDPIAALRCHIAQRVAGWSDAEWTHNVPDMVRSMATDGSLCKCPVTDPNCKCLTICAQRDHFVDLCSQRDRPISPALFHFASIILQVGVLLLVLPGRGQQHVFDFGTSDYSRSVFIVSLHSTVQGSDLTHYETVGLRLESPGGNIQHQTAFVKDDIVLKAIRDHAVRCSDGKTVEHQRLFYYRFPCPTAAGSPDGPLQPFTQSITHTSTPQYQERRAIRPPQRFVQQPAAGTIITSVQAASCNAPQPPQPALAVDQPPGPGDQPLGAALQPDARARVRKQPAVQRRATAPKPATHCAPPAVRPREGLSLRQQVTAGRVLRNVRDWVRKMARVHRLASRVHFSCIPLWTLRCRAALQSLVAALRAERIDECAVIAHLCAFWMLPGEVFSTPARTGGGKRRRKALHNRIRYNLEDRHLFDRLRDTAYAAATAGSSGSDLDQQAWTALSATLSQSSWTPAGATSESGSSGDGDVELSDQPSRHSRTARSVADASAAQRVGRLLELGHPSKAMQTLTSVTSLADLDDDDERGLLRQLHPMADGPMPACPDDAPELVVDSVWMAEAMRTSDTGAATGPSGWGSNFLAVLADDPHCVEAMSFFIQQIINNRLPETVRTLLTTSFLISIKKEVTGTGRRPIAIGDMFCRLAGRYTSMLVMPELQRAVAPHQYGCGLSDGCTQVVQSVQHLLTTPAAAPPSADGGAGRPLACLSIDLSNAFNSVDRRAVLRAVYDNPDLARCWRMVDFAYGRPSLLLMQCDDCVPDSDAFLESQMGVRQGDPLATMLFCLVMAPVYAAAAGRTSRGCFAFVDDGHLIGTVDECWRLWQDLPQLLAPLKLSLNRSKCELTCFALDHLRDERDTAALRQFRQESNGLTVNEDSLRLLGCVVGRDAASIAGRLCTDERFRLDQLAAFRRLKLLKKQHGMLALRRLSGAVINNRLRAMPPATTIEHARQYDRRVLAAAHVIIGITSVHGDMFDELLQMPLSVGGFGLTSAAQLAAAAYLAGAEITIRHSPVFADVWQGSSVLDPSCGLFTAIDDCLSRIAAQELSLQQRLNGCVPSITVPASVLPSTAADFVPHFRAQPPCSIQSSVSYRITTQIFNARVAEADGAGRREEAARLHSLCVRHSALWLETLPVEDAFKLGDHQWQWAARLRLGMDVPVVDAACSGCKSTTAYCDNSWHALSCVALSGADITLRHNAVVSFLAQFSNLMSCPCRMEPLGCSADTNERPDIRMDLMNDTLLVDVTITHPTAKSHRNAVAARRSADCIGDASEARKNKQYAQDAGRQHKSFLPFVLYTYGGFHRSALAVIAAMTSSLEPARCLLSRAAWRHQLMQSIAIAVQRGNAAIMVAASRQGRAAAHDRRVSRNRLNFERPSAGGVRQVVSSAASAAAVGAAAVPHLVYGLPAADSTDISGELAAGAAAVLDRAPSAVPVVTDSQPPAVVESLDASDLTPCQRAVSPADRSVAAASGIVDSDGDSWWEHQVPDAARAINARVVPCHDTVSGAAEAAGPVAAGAAGAACSTVTAQTSLSLHGTASGTCAAVGRQVAPDAAAARDGCTDHDMASGYAGQDAVVLSDADTEMLHDSVSDCRASVDGSCPDDAAAACKRGGSVLGANADALGGAMPRTQCGTGRLRLPEWRMECGTAPGVGRGADG